MAEELQLKVTADTAAAVSDLKKTEQAVDEVTKSTKELDAAGASSAKAVATTGAASKQAAQDVAKLGEATSSARGMFKGLAEMGGELGQKLGMMAGKVIAVVSAFTMGYQAGLQFRKGLEEIGVKLPDLSDKMAKLVLSIDETVRGYERAELVESAAMNRARQIIALREAQAVAEAALGRAQAAAGVEWKNADAEREKVIQKINAIEQILARTTKTEEAYGAAIKANAPLLLEVAKAAEAQGIALEKVGPRTAEAAEAAEKYAAAQKGLAAAIPAATEAMSTQAAALEYGNAAFDRSVAAQEIAIQKQQDWRASTDSAEEGMRKWTDATQGAGKAFGALSGDFTSLNAAVADYVAQGGDVAKLQVSMSTIALSVARASDEATAALYRQIEATRLLRDEQLQALDVAQGWRDYLANLKEGYDVGLTSLTGYMNALIAFKTQLLQLFSSASGEAKKGLEDIIAAIEALMQSVGTRAPFDSSYAGELDRAFNNPRGRN